MHCPSEVPMRPNGHKTNDLGSELDFALNIFEHLSKMPKTPKPAPNGKVQCPRTRDFS